MKVSGYRVESAEEEAVLDRRFGQEFTLLFWGSECLECLNATCGTMICDQCQSAEQTRPLWMMPPPTVLRLAAVPELQR